MKTPTLILGLMGMGAVLGWTPVWAATVVVEDGSQVTVNQTPRVAIDQVGTKTVVVEKQPSTLTVVKDSRTLEGEIIRVDHPSYTIVVRDIDGREKRVLLKRGMINNYKVDDYVIVRLTPDLQEALEIKTKHVADIEGDVVRVDRSNGRIIVREKNGSERAVIARSDMIGNYKVGDFVRLYVVVDDANYQEVKMIRVR